MYPGKKNDLVERMREALEKRLPLLQNLSKEKEKNLAGDSFSPGAYWSVLECDGEFVDENTPDGFRAPTVPDGENSSVKKRNYTQRFDRMVFTGLIEVPMRCKRGKILKDKKGQVRFQRKQHTKTEVNMNFIRKHKLNLLSHPALWFEAFVPIKDQGEDFNMEKVLSWTNMRAWLDNASLGGKYNDFEHFTLDDLLRHIGLYLFHGLSPSPQIEMKFHRQCEDHVNGNDFVHFSFGGNTSKSKRRHRHFKRFFCSNDPRFPTPSRSEAPNWKVHPLLKHIPKVSQEAIFLGQDLSCDEQTIGFQGHHRDKQRITYKKEGDGFLTDCICSDGYTYCFHFRHQEASSKIMQEFGCSPLHARVLGLISQLPHAYYTLGMDNLFMSAKFCRIAYSMDQKVMVHGVTRPSLRGIPSLIKQEEVKRKKDLELVRHTVKAAKLEGDTICKDLVSISLYDTKPVYFLTNSCAEIKWISKTKKVYDASKKKTINMQFPRLNVVDFYNNNMGNVDLADQLRNYYRIDTSWHRNRKWWWSIWWWGFQVLLTNSYIAYKKYHLFLDSDKILTHYDFIKAIALSWINREQYWPKEQTKKIKRKPDDNQIMTRQKKRVEFESLSSSSNNSKCIRINDSTLHPVSGKLNCRLNTSVQHFPEEPKTKRPRCALHRWARGREEGEVMKQVLTCSVCRVNLCISCFNIFHKEANLLDRKDAIAKYEKSKKMKLR